MIELETEKEGCSSNTEILPGMESFRFPLDNSMHITFTGYFNGFNVEIRSTEEITLLYHMGCFGKGSNSRSKPAVSRNRFNPPVIRKRQLLKRNSWHKKFGACTNISKTDLFLKEIEDVTKKILDDSKRERNKDVIDLVSSDDAESGSGEENQNTYVSSCENFQKEDMVIMVPNSDSEGDNYFANLKPKYCINKVRTREKLILSLQESFFLLYGLGCLQIKNLDNKFLSVSDCWQLFLKTDVRFIPKYVVYHYFRSKGYIVKPGIKFGGDFLLYKEGPGITHADYIVVIKQNQEIKLDWVAVLGHVRMATTTVKEVLIAEVIMDKEECILPQDLSSYKVRELLLKRNVPIVVDDSKE